MKVDKPERPIFLISFIKHARFCYESSPGVRTKVEILFSRHPLLLIELKVEFVQIHLRLSVHFRDAQAVRFATVVEEFVAVDRFELSRRGLSGLTRIKCHTDRINCNQK